MKTPILLHSNSLVNPGGEGAIALPTGFKRLESPASQNDGCRA